jgi:hypothetical protein
MAKQTFTTGQVLLASQLTSLQQTAMLGGAASAKTASYTLVAADAGTAITMNNASATTITVNTGLLAEGDTVHITNLGAGVCTITAGTATVNSSASLALAQYESGFLDFTSTSAAIFVKGAGAAATSGGMTLLSTTSLTGASVTISSIPSGYVNLKLLVQNYRPATDSSALRVRINADTGTRYGLTNTFGDPANLTFGNDHMTLGPNSDNGTSTGLLTIDFFDYSNATIWKQCFSMGFSVNPTTVTNWNSTASIGMYNQTTAITSLLLFPSGGNFTSGTALLYGVK